MAYASPLHEYICETLAGAVEKRHSVEQRAAHGTSMRQQFHLLLSQGIAPTHPRFIWLQEQSKLLADLLFTMGEDFDKAHADDAATFGDLIDILNMTKGGLSRFPAQTPLAARNKNDKAVAASPVPERSPEVSPAPEPEQNIVGEGEGDGEDDGEGNE